MDKKQINAFENVQYAKLSEQQLKKLREFESKFNYEFGVDFNIMAMKNENE
ncbi:hypothetical protein NBE98_08875 [Clostridium swellfunianum]|uniref:hypothetical protein n=1 Tax=Clostridium swellfunianum TaxID=1367462 RepID=UPI00202E83EA|nr:hypothetical protein [Clostridium swellfunianum]MCM0648487.1 hypothetical protein [Clostridium swellfunianum]